MCLAAELNLESCFQIVFAEACAAVGSHVSAMQGGCFQTAVKGCYFCQEPQCLRSLQSLQSGALITRELPLYCSQAKSYLQQNLSLHRIHRLLKRKTFAYC